jgi:hypothetical protein
MSAWSCLHDAASAVANNAIDVIEELITLPLVRKGFIDAWFLMLMY